MVSYSSNFFQNDINSIAILIMVINLLPNLINTYIGPQFLKAAKTNDFVRNFCVLVGIILLVQISTIQEQKFETAIYAFLFLLVFSRQTIEFNMLQIILMLYIFSKYNENDDSVMDSKITSYNSKKIKVKICEICKNRPSTDTHHLQFQENADSKGYINKQFHKNTKANLVSICKECHKKYY